MDFDQSVFKANDIRGKYPDPIDPSFSYLLGRAIVCKLGVETVLVGRDGRLSSPELASAVRAGVEAAGGRIEYVGLCPSELVYYLMGSKTKYDVAVMVTASHNPPEYNGFKLVKPGGAPLTSVDGLSEVKEWMREADTPGIDGAAEPEQTVFARDEYIDFVMDLAGDADLSGLNVVVDPGNGTGGVLWGELERVTGLDAVKMNYEADGEFPAHMPNPAKMENVWPLIERVRTEGADIGFTFDGDSDRTVAVLGNGKVVGGSQMIAALVESLFGDSSDAVSAVSMTSSRKLIDFLLQRGPEPRIVPVGHAKIKRIMHSDSDIDFAGEESGHYFFREFFCCESSLITCLHLLQLVADGRLTELISDLPGPWVRPDPEPAFSCARRQNALCACRKAAYGTIKEFPEPREIMCEHDWEVARDCKPAEIEDATGVRIDYADWWVAVRPSCTEPLVRLTGEARTEEDLDKKMELIGQFFDHCVAMTAGE